MLKKVVLGGAALWVAPTVMVFDTKPAFATTCAGATQQGVLPFPGAGPSMWTVTSAGFSATVGGRLGFSATEAYGTLSAPNFVVERDPDDRTQRAPANLIPLAGFTATAWATYCRQVVLCAGVSYRITFSLRGRNINPRDQLFWVSLGGVAQPMAGLPGSPRTSVLATNVTDGQLYTVTVDFSVGTNQTTSLCFNHAIRSGQGSVDLTADDFGEGPPTLSVLP